MIGFLSKIVRLTQTGEPHQEWRISFVKAERSETREKVTGCGGGDDFFLDRLCLH
jgi:hypothetical protein